MPLAVGSQLDLKQIPILGLVFTQSAGAVATPSNGQVWYDTTANRFMGRENGASVQLSRTGALLNGDAAGGDLTGSYPSPTVANLAITAAKIANSTITDTQVAAANKDGAVGVASMRTIGNGALQAMAGNTRLDQITAPTAPVGFNAQRATGLADPTAAQDAATKNYVDSMSAGLDVKGSVRAASTANVTVTYNATGGTSGRGQITAAPNTLDGITLVNGNRILLKDQTTGAQNGIWVVTTVGTGANGQWDRATDFDADTKVTAGAFTFVEEGTLNDNSGWTLTTNNPITIGGGAGTALTWAKFSSAASLNAGAGLVQNGQNFDVVGTANRIDVFTDNIDISANYVGQASITTLGTIGTGVWQGTAVAVGYGGTGSNTAAGARTNLGAVGRASGTTPALTAGVEGTITHNLNTTEAQVDFRDATTDQPYLVTWRPTGVNTVGVTIDIAAGLAAGALKWNANG